MAMNETLTLTLAWIAGAALGGFFFGGLWWTIRKACASEEPALWFFGSLLLRMGIALAGFYFVSGGDWKRLVLCLLGFIVARLAVIWLTRTPQENQKQPAKEASHAP
jgi:F1F0 ATPase subunit 2